MLPPNQITLLLNRIWRQTCTKSCFIVDLLTVYNNNLLCKSSCLLFLRRCKHSVSLQKWVFWPNGFVVPPHWIWPLCPLVTTAVHNNTNCSYALYHPIKVALFMICSYREYCPFQLLSAMADVPLPCYCQLVIVIVVILTHGDHCIVHSDGNRTTTTIISCVPFIPSMTFQ